MIDYEILDSTPSYHLYIGKGYDYDDNDVYVIKNIETGILEFETRLLAQALKILPELQAALDAMREVRKDEVASVENNVVSFNKNLN